jgi:hypothetical protein
MFKKGDVVICVGWDNLPINNEDYSPSLKSGINVLTHCGYVKDQQMIVLDIFEDLLIFTNLNGYGKVSIYNNNFEKLSTIRERKLTILLK